MKLFLLIIILILSATITESYSNEISMKNSLDLCNSSNEGAIRYVSTDKAFEGCNGTSWQELSSSQSTYKSPWTDISTNTKYEFAHGLGQTPDIVIFKARNKNSPSEEIIISPQFAYGYSNYGGLRTSGATSINVYFYTGTDSNLAMGSNLSYITVADAEIQAIAISLD